MSALTLSIDMQGKCAVIVGGGTVALRKLRTLLKTGAAVQVIAMDICPEISALSDDGVLSVTIGPYVESALDDAFLVVAATDNPVVNEQVCRDARSRRILVSVADNPTAGDCTFPAILKRGDLEISVSTGGRCPTFAADVRDSIKAHIGHEYGAILDRLAEEREKLLTNGSPSTYNTQVLRSLAAGLLAELTERKDSLP